MGISVAQDQDEVEQSDVVYHYTSADAMIAIIQNRTLWFTDCQYLNDRHEYVSICKPLRETYNEVKGSLEWDYDLSIKSTLESFESNYEVIGSLVPNRSIGRLQFLRNRYFIFCASTNPDSLSMWKYYSDGATYNGDNIGIQVTKLNSTLARSLSEVADYQANSFSGKVIYDEDEIREALRRLILGVDEELRQHISELPDNTSDLDFEKVVNTFDSKMISGIQQLRLLYKNMAFAEEQEYRFVVEIPANNKRPMDSNLSSKGPNKRFRSKNGIVIPYCDISFDDSDLISEINIAPGKDGDLAERGIRQLLRESGYPDAVAIKCSNISVRY